jgi:hypothetical protein
VATEEGREEMLARFARRHPGLEFRAGKMPNRDLDPAFFLSFNRGNVLGNAANRLEGRWRGVWLSEFDYTTGVLTGFVGSHGPQYNARFASFSVARCETRRAAPLSLHPEEGLAHPARG